MTDHFAQAVEALVKARLGCGPNCKDEHKAEAELAAHDLKRALPHLRRMWAEKLRAEARSSNLDERPQAEVVGWFDAADFVEGK